MAVQARLLRVSITLMLGIPRWSYQYDVTKSCCYDHLSPNITVSGIRGTYLQSLSTQLLKAIRWQINVCASKCIVDLFSADGRQSNLLAQYQKDVLTVKERVVLVGKRSTTTRSPETIQSSYTYVQSRSKQAKKSEPTLHLYFYKLRKGTACSTRETDGPISCAIVPA